MSYTYPYPRPAVTVDVALLRATPTGVEVLLIQRGRPPFTGNWALPGGFVDENEPLEVAARRELREETGIMDIPLRQFAAFGDPGRDPRGWTVSVVFWASVAGLALAPQAGDDAAATRWWPLAALPPLAFDHADILKALAEKLAERNTGG